MVVVSFVGYHGERIFDERQISFTLGEGPEHNIPEGLEQALLKFKKGERSLIRLKSHCAFGATGCSSLGIPPNADIEYNLELKNFEKAKESWSMDGEEKLQQSVLCKEKGTNHFKNGKYNLALNQYKKIISYLEFEKS